MNKKSVLLSICSTVLIMGISASANENTFTIATCTGIPPFEYTEKEDMVGVDIQIAEFLAEDLDADLLISDMGYQEVLEAVKNGEVPVGISAIPIDESSIEDYDYSDAYYTGDLKIMVKNSGSDWNLEELNGKRLGTFQNFADVENEKQISCKMTVFDSLETAMEALDENRVDGIIMDEMTAEMIRDTYEDIHVVEERWAEISYGVIIEKGNEDMLLEVNELLALMEESGELQKIFEKYVGVEEETEQNS